MHIFPPTNVIRFVLFLEYANIRCLKIIHLMILGCLWWCTLCSKCMLWSSKLRWFTDIKSMTVADASIIRFSFNILRTIIKVSCDMEELNLIIDDVSSWEFYAHSIDTAHGKEKKSTHLRYWVCSKQVARYIQDGIQQAKDDSLAHDRCELHRVLMLAVRRHTTS